MSSWSAPDLSKNKYTRNDKGNEYFQEIKGSKYKELKDMEWHNDLDSTYEVWKIEIVNGIESSEQTLLMMNCFLIVFGVSTI